MLGLGGWFGLSGNPEVDTSAGSKAQESDAKVVKLQRRDCGQVTEGSDQKRTSRANVSADFSIAVGDMATVFRISKPAEDESTLKNTEKQTSKRSRGMWGEVGREPEDDGCVIC
jgi:hypothetical protein